jgi:arminomycin 4-O-methyltransferase/SAM-dependent hydroxylase
VAPAPADSAPLPRDPVTVLRNLGDLATPMALRVAATFRIVDHLNAGTTRLADLAVATELPEDVLGRVLRHLVAVDVLTEMPAGTFAPTAVGALLAHGHPQSAAGWLNTEHMMGRADLAFVDLLKAMWSGHTAYRLRYGTDFWADALAANRSATFDAAMARDGKASFRAVNAAYDWSGVRHVLDVGGGNGTLLRALLRGQPHLRATLLELSGPAAAARAAFDRAGLTDRVDIVVGNFFEPFGVRADVIVLSAILHHWKDADAERILRRCSEALTPGGRVLLIERAPGRNELDAEFTRADLSTLVHLGGRERTRDEWVDVVDRAGFTVATVSRPLDRQGRCLVELQPADGASEPPPEERRRAARAGRRRQHARRRARIPT